MITYYILMYFIDIISIRMYLSTLHLSQLFKVAPGEEAAALVAPQGAVREAQVQHGADRHAALQVVLQEALHRQIAARRVASRPFF